MNYEICSRALQRQTKLFNFHSSFIWVFSLIWIIQLFSLWSFFSIRPHDLLSFLFFSLTFNGIIVGALDTDLVGLPEICQKYILCVVENKKGRKQSFIMWLKEVLTAVERNALLAPGDNPGWHSTVETVTWTCSRCDKQNKWATVEDPKQAWTCCFDVLVLLRWSRNVRNRSVRWFNCCVSAEEMSVLET